MSMRLREYLMIIEGLVPALKRTSDGEVFFGKKGEMHFHVYNAHKGDLHDKPFESGFYDEETKQFLTRDEALKKHGFDRSEHSPEYLKTHNLTKDQVIALRKRAGLN